MIPALNLPTDYYKVPSLEIIKTQAVLFWEYSRKRADVEWTITAFYWNLHLSQNEKNADYPFHSRKGQRPKEIWNPLWALLFWNSPKTDSPEYYPYTCIQVMLFRRRKKWKTWVQLMPHVTRFQKVAKISVSLTEKCFKKLPISTYNSKDLKQSKKMDLD